MNSSQIYILIAIIVLAIIAAVIFFLKKDQPAKKLSRLAALAFAFVLAGIIFSENRLVGYGLMGVGVILAIVDAVKKSKKIKNTMPNTTIKHLLVSSLDGQIQKLTIAAGPVIMREVGGIKEVLLDKHEDVFWKFPGGSLQDDNTFRQNAIREVGEELNIKVELDERAPYILTFVREGEVFVLVHYLAWIVEGEPSAGRDVTEFGWFDIKNLPADCGPNIKPAVEALK